MFGRVQQFMIDKRFQGKGIGTKALELILDGAEPLKIRLLGKRK